MEISALVLVVAAYAALATGYLEARRHREPPPAWARATGPITVIVHLVGLIALSSLTGRSPFQTGSQAMSFLAFSVAALYLLMEAVSRVATHGGGFYALATLLAAVSVPGLVTSSPETVEAAKNATRTVHVGLALMGTAAVLAGGLLGGGYVGAYRRVKQGALRGGAEGPSLKGFERLARLASVLGVLLLAPGIVLGISAGTGEQAQEGMKVLTGITALLFLLVGCAAWLWWFRPRRGRLAAWLNLFAMLGAILAFGLVHPLVLARGG
ncbi:MAG: hypothetical protein ACYTG6_18315 [Planctomycetota bacterium]